MNNVVDVLIQANSSDCELKNYKKKFYIRIKYTITFFRAHSFIAYIHIKSFDFSFYYLDILYLH